MENVLKQRFNFDDIQPYRDSEVPQVLKRLCRDPELLDLLVKRKFPALVKPLRLPMRWVWSWMLRSKIVGIDSKGQFQSKFIAPAIERMLESTRTKFSYSGLEELDPRLNYLFVSNHRDIAMDPAFANYALYLDDHKVAQIGFGDNLMQANFATDLMRINRGFIVERNKQSVRDKVRSAQKLSQYLKNSLESGESIWLAQREGRAKDGIDGTDPTLLTMLYMAWRRSLPFALALERMRIVPLSISYQYDPCDQLKARELYTLEEHGSYTKRPGEDLTSLALGLSGSKGRVHLHFGPALTKENADQESAHQWLDEQIVSNYRLHSSNWTCWRLLKQEQQGEEGFKKLVSHASTLFSIKEDDFYDQPMLARLTAADPELRPLMVDAYAGVVERKIKLAVG